MTPKRQQAPGNHPSASKSDIAAAAAAMGRKGGQVKCKKGLATLTASERTAMAQRGANARWRGNGTVERCPCGVMTLKRARARGKSAEHEPGCEFRSEGKRQ